MNDPAATTLPSATEPPEDERPATVAPAASAAPWRAGAEAAWANRWPGAALAAFAVGLLMAYHFVPLVHDALSRVAQLKLQTGFAFSMVSTALFGGVIPWLVQRLRPGPRNPDATVPVLLFFIVFWAIKGVEVDALYRLQAVVFGDNASLGTIFLKVLADQLVYVPLWAIPTSVVAYAWKDQGFSWSRLRQGFFVGRWYRRRVVPVLISNWAVWLPAVVVIYSLPLALQLPIQNLVLCFWSLLLVLQVRLSNS